MKDTDVIDAFISFLCARGYPGLKVDRRPDKENRTSEDIDAIAGSFAIEHTSIDTLPNQRKDSDWFIKAIGGLEKEFYPKLSFRLRITIEYDAVTKGQDWALIRQSLKKWIIDDAPFLDNGHHVFEQIPGIPFRLYVLKASDRSTGLLFSRFEPYDDTLPNRIYSLFERKAQKLSKYSKGYTTVLLVENDDIALMNEAKLLDSIKKVYPEKSPEGVCKIWYADTTNPSQPEFTEFYSDGYTL